MEKLLFKELTFKHHAFQWLFSYSLLLQVFDLNIFSTMAAYMSHSLLAPKTYMPKHSDEQIKITTG